MSKIKPHPISDKQKQDAMNSLPEPIILKLCEFVHDAWWQAKLDMGWHHPSDKHPEWKKSPKNYCDKCHPDMVPYGELQSQIQNLDRISVSIVIAGLKSLGYEIKLPK